jgi:hypothetical protein
MAAYMKAKVDLEQALGTTLGTYNISIQEALSGRVSRPPSAIPPLQP